jgi:ribosomal protein S18 acetylase RimI-like enzyme
MNAAGLAVVEITRLDDELLLPWLDLYETAFPPDQKVLVSHFLRLLQERAAGRDNGQLMLAAQDANGFAGLAFYQLLPEAALAHLWYLAIAAERRGHHLGAALYYEIVARVQRAGARALFLEVEDPAQATTAQQAALAVRRIGFYRRLGARLLGGVHYLQYVGAHQPEIPMHLMAHTWPAATPAWAYTEAKRLFGDFLSQTGELSLT